MKHLTIDNAGDTRDLERALWLSRLPAKTRNATIASVRKISAVLGVDHHLEVKTLQAIVQDVTPEVRQGLGKFAPQILSDARRALRVWDDAPLRWLALSIRGRIPTLRDAQIAAGISMGEDDAARVSNAITAFAQSQEGLPEDLPATESQIGRLLKNASPEDFGVSSLKSVENKRSLILRAVRLVDPSRKKVRDADLKALPKTWRMALEAVSNRLAEHEKSPLAIAKRFVVFASSHGAIPATPAPALVQAFYSAERALRATGHEEKLRRFARAWNEAAKNATGLCTLVAPSVVRHRQAEVRWQDVPAEIRTPLDDILERAVSVRTESAWEDLVVEDAGDEYAEFGLDQNPATSFDGALILEPGTRKNWRNAVKRAWHAAMESDRIFPKPTSLSDLCTVDVAKATVLGARRARRQRAEANNEPFNPKKKERYEHSLIEALCAVGRANGLSSDDLEDLQEFKRGIDPAVIAVKMNADGSKKYVYAERRIGDRHAKRLAAFAEEGQLRRYFEAPAVLWKLANAGMRNGKKPTRTHVALARNAVILRLAQYGGPLRRTSFVTLRYQGDDPHLLLPVSDREGTLVIPAIETKALKAVHIQLDRETVKMLKAYIRDFLPSARRYAGAPKENPHLFPGADGNTFPDGMGHLTKGKVNNTFKAQLWRHCRIKLNLHVMRHLSGKIILDQDPSAMELVRILLGHKSIKTTHSYYAEVNSIIAQRRYLHLLEKSQRKVLAKVHFKVLEK